MSKETPGSLASEDRSPQFPPGPDGISDVEPALADGQNGSKSDEEKLKVWDFMWERNRITFDESPALDKLAEDLLDLMENDLADWNKEYYDDVFEEWATRKDRHQALWDLSRLHAWRFLKVDGGMKYEWAIHNRGKARELIEEYEVPWRI